MRGGIRRSQGRNLESRMTASSRRPGEGRRFAALEDQAGGVRPLRRDRRVPRQRRPAPDQDGAGRQAGRGRPAARAQGVGVHRASCATPRRACGLISPPPHHDIYSSRISRSSSTTSRTRIRRPRSASSWCRKSASARSPRAWRRPRPTTSPSAGTTAARAPRRLVDQARRARRGSWAWPRRSRPWC